MLAHIQPNREFVREKYLVIILGYFSFFSTKKIYYRYSLKASWQELLISTKKSLSLQRIGENCPGLRRSI